MGGSSGNTGATRRAIIKAGLSLAAAGGVGWAGTAYAEERYPTQPIRLVVPFAPGGAVDIVARIVAKGLTDSLGQQVLVDNRSGGGGTIGTAYVAKSPPDGYTLLLHTVSSAVINAYLYTNLSYDPRKDVIPITEIAASATLIVINANVPAKTVQEFVALVKANPGKYNFGSTGIGTSVHLDGQLFATREGLTMTHVPYRGEGDAIKDLIAGETQMETGVASAFLPYIQAGQLRALCVNSNKRLSILPDVPTAAEAGLSDFELPNWYALYAPNGLPDSIKNRLYEATSNVLKIDGVRKQMAELGLDIIGSTPAEMTAYLDQQFKFWQPVVEASGVKM